MWHPGVTAGNQARQAGHFRVPSHCVFKEASQRNLSTLTGHIQTDLNKLGKLLHKGIALSRNLKTVKIAEIAAFQGIADGIINAINKRKEADSFSLFEQLKEAVDKKDYLVIEQCFALIGTGKALQGYLLSREGEMVDWLKASCMLEDGELQETCWKAVQKVPLEIKRILGSGDYQLNISNQGIETEHDFCEMVLPFDYMLLKNRFPFLDSLICFNPGRVSYPVVYKKPMLLFDAIVFLLSGKIRIDKGNWRDLYELAKRYRMGALIPQVLSWLEKSFDSERNWIEFYQIAVEHSRIDLVRNGRDWFMENICRIPVDHYHYYLNGVIEAAKNCKNGQIEAMSQEVIDLMLGYLLILMSDPERDVTIVKSLLKKYGAALAVFDIKKLGYSGLFGSLDCVPRSFLNFVGEYCPNVRGLHLINFPGLDSEGVKFIHAHLGRLEEVTIGRCSVDIKQKRPLLKMRSRTSLPKLLPVSANVAANLVSLDLSDNKMLNDELFNDLARGQRNQLLKVLRLKNCPNVSSVALQRIGNFTNLNELILTGCAQINDEAAITIAKSVKELRVLELGGCAGLINGLSSLIFASQGLMRLNLEGCQVNLGTVLTIRYCKDLEELDISHCPAVENTAVDQLSGLDRLRWVNLSDSPLIDYTSVNRVIEQCKGLKEMNLDRCGKVSAEGVHAREGLKLSTKGCHSRHRRASLVL